MARRRKPAINYYRNILQWGILTLLIYMVLRPIFDKTYGADFEAYCPFGGMQSLAGYLQKHSLACSMTTVQMGLGIALLTAVIVFSKLFCSYICPIGTFTEWMGSLGRKFKMNLIIKGKADRLLRSAKYILLFVTFFFTITESELYCRKFDPYYASFTGFSSDVFLWFALPALLFTVVGSFFIRQLWCKYLCPLGAVTNLAVYALPASTLSLLWVLLTSAAGLTIPWPWLLGSICLMGFLFEATTLEYFIFPTLRIQRHDNICTHCRICDKQCPMALQISKVGSVKHIDCHLCTECVVQCTEKGALTINQSIPRWIPALATIVLIVAAITITNKYELPTISENWGDVKARHVGRVSLDGLKNIKCFGSSRSFADQMKEVMGVMGVETYMKHHRVVVYFDSTRTTATQVKEAIFAPLTELLNFDGKLNGNIHFITLGIDRCFDPNDQSYLYELLRQEKGVLALSTRYGEPMQATIYYDEMLTDTHKIEAAVSKDVLTMGEGKEQTIVETGFKVNKSAINSGIIAIPEFLSLFIPATDASFNKYESYRDDEVLVYELPFEQAAQPDMQQWLPYLISHASNDDGIVRLQTVYSDEGPELRIWFVNKLTTVNKINTMLQSTDFIVHYPDKSVKKVKNPFRFKI